MEALNSSTLRKLLVGERVEVRQKEKGLRGSWHSGVVVQVKNSRRVVEYDELLTLDGLQKLRESIPLLEDVRSQPSALRERNGAQSTQNPRGFIRPTPPPCVLPSPQNWSRGLLVDAFYHDAWWEGILLENARPANENVKVRTLFPEEGDELRISMKNMRVSQDWDEATGQWAVRGHWSLFSEDKRADFSPLKQICRQKRSFLKQLWRQKRFSRCDKSGKEEQRNSCSAPSQNECKEKEGPEHCGHLDQGKVLAQNGKNTTAVLDGIASMSLRVPQFLEINSKCLAVPGFAETGAVTEKEQLPCIQHDDAFTEKTLDGEQCSVNYCKIKACPVESEKAMERPKEHPSSLLLLLPFQARDIVSPHGALASSDVLLTQLASEERKDGFDFTVSQMTLVSNANVNEGVTEQEKTLSGEKLERRGVSNSRRVAAARKLAKARPTSTSKIEVKLTRNQSSGRYLKSKLVKENSKHATLDDKSSFTVDPDSCQIASDVKQDGIRNPDNSLSMGIERSLSQHGPCQQGNLEVDENVSEGMEGFMSKNTLQMKELLKQARLSATKFLLDGGWWIEGRIHHSRKEAVYVSPDGRRYYSLASACRGLKKVQNLPTCSDGEDERPEVKLLNSYNITKGFMCLENPCIGQTQIEHKISPLSSDRSMKAKRAILSSSVVKAGSPSSRNVPAEVLEDKNSLDQFADKNGFHMSCQKRIHCAAQTGEVGLKSSLSPMDKSYLKEPKYRRSKLITPHVQKSAKRKHDVQDFCVVEPRCKKSKPFLKKATLVQDSKGRGCRMQVLLSPPVREKGSCFGKGSAEASHFKKTTVLSWLIDKGILKENESLSYLGRRHGHILKKGQVTREGVLCTCCMAVFTLSNFEVHAGSKCHRPSANIFLDDGRSIAECQMQACAIQESKDKKEALIDSSDDTCGVCGDGGELILCDHCPSTFHADCIGLAVIPEGDWYCPRCCCGVCGGSQLEGDGEKTMLHCTQCELGYHLTCVYAHGMKRSSRASKKYWFCGHRCEEIFTGLRGLVGITNPLVEGLSWMLLRSMSKDHGITPSSFDVMAEYNSKLSVALCVMQECFVPMIDPHTNIDLIAHALYNRRSKVSRLDYSGFYTVLLERGDELITVATIRVHGTRLAEMPLVGTRYQYRRQGMCRRLMHALEEMLKKIGVEKLILPAVPELLEAWIHAFGFQHMSDSERCEVNKLNLMSFPGTTLLQKHLTGAAHINESLCQLFTSDRVDNLESSLHKSEKDISAKREPLLQDLHSDYFHGDGLHTPAAVGNAESHVNTLSNRGVLEGQSMRNSQIEGPGKYPRVGVENKNDDIYNSKVILTTTRSKRLVKSSRWIVDGLKELAKEAKQSKRALGMDRSVPKAFLCKVTGNMKCGVSLKELGQAHDTERSCQIIDNAYIRTRTKATQPLFLMEEGKELPRDLEFTTIPCTAESVYSVAKFNSNTVKSTITDAHPVFPISNNSSDLNGSRMFDHIDVSDEALQVNTRLRDDVDGKYCAYGMHKDGDLNIQAAKSASFIYTGHHSTWKEIEGQEEIGVNIARGDCEATDMHTTASFLSSQPSFGASIGDKPQDMNICKDSHECDEKLSGGLTSYAFGTGSSSCACAVASLAPAAVEGQGLAAAVVL